MTESYRVLFKIASCQVYLGLVFLFYMIGGVNMKKKIELIIFIIIILASSVTVGYAYHDQLSVSRNIETTIGNWWFEKTYSSGFESYTTTSYSTTNNVSIDGRLWNIQNVITANSSDDSFFNQRGLRFRNTSQIESAQSFYGIESISFYFGRVRGGLFNLGTSAFTVDISNDRSSYTTIYSGTASTSFSLISIDLESLLRDGYTLSNNVVVNLESEIYFRIRFTGSGLFTDRLVNMDNLVVNYRSEGIR